jgi:uncharacterized protein YkwD
MGFARAIIHSADVSPSAFLAIMERVASALLLPFGVKLLRPFLFLLALLPGLAAFAGEKCEQVLAEINLARTAPQEYARIVAERGGNSRDVDEAVRFLQRARPLPPLSLSSGLSQGAQMHVSQQGPTGQFGHGSNPFGRMEKFGQWVGCAGENISYGKFDARSIVCQLIVDSGVSGRGHRKNIFSSGYGTAGIAYGPHAHYGAMCVIDFAGRFIERGGAIASL